jgi:hypothetical protein
MEDFQACGVRITAGIICCLAPSWQSALAALKQHAHIIRAQVGRVSSLRRCLRNAPFFPEQ